MQSGTIQWGWTKHNMKFVPHYYYENTCEVGPNSDTSTNVAWLTCRMIAYAFVTFMKWGYVVLTLMLNGRG
jgi:hypothetical protein